jgi:hypothetical protein
LADVSRGILDDVKFSHQTVEFVIVLSAPCDDAVWFKGGRRVAPSDHPLGRASQLTYRSGSSYRVPPSKFSASVKESGRVHMLVVNDVHVEDEGIYTFGVSRPDDDDDRRLGSQAPSVRYRIEGSTDAANVTALMKGLAERQASAGKAESTGTKAAAAAAAADIGTDDC